MAERRMFHTTVVESDAFLDLPIQAQALYFHLGMYADDDGFVNGPKQIARKTHIPVSKLQLLIDRGFILDLDGVVVLRHWRVANTLRKARLKPLQYPDFAQKLYIRDNGIYTLSSEEGDISLWEERMSIGRPTDVQWMPKVREEKVSEEKITEDKIIEGKVREGKVTDPSAGSDATADSDRIKQNGIIHLSAKEVGDLVNQIGLDYFTYYVERLAKFIQDNNASVKNHYATILKWCREDGRI